jgi:hypothetical protein
LENEYNLPKAGEPKLIRSVNASPTALSAILALLLSVPNLPSAETGCPSIRVASEIETIRVALPDVLSKAKLNPPVQSRVVAVHFSADGNYILVRDTSEIYVLTRKPLFVKLRIAANLSLDAAFSDDSRTLIVATRVDVERWGLDDGKVLGRHQFDPDNECYDTALSRNGEFYGCIDKNLKLRIYRATTHEQVFASSVGKVPDYYGVLPSGAPPATQPVPPDSPPLSSASKQLRFSPSSYPMPFLDPFIQFSPDGHYVLAGTFPESNLAVDLREGKKMGLSRNVQSGLGRRALQFIGPDTVFIAGDGHAKSEILSFPNGRMKCQVNGRNADSTSNPQFGLLHSNNGEEIVAEDLHGNVPVVTVSADGADVLGRNIVFHTTAGEVRLSGLDGTTVADQLELPAGSLTTMHVAVVSAGLSAFALAVPGDGAAYDVANGNRLARFGELIDASFLDDQTLYLERPQNASSFPKVEKLDLGSGTIKDAGLTDAFHSKGEFLFSGAVLLDYQTELYSYPSLGSVDWSPPPFKKVRVDAIDLASGKRLWQNEYDPDYGYPCSGYRNCGFNPPRLYTDPQNGDRAVLVWNGTQVAHLGPSLLAKRIPAVAREIQAKTLSDKDSVFEVIDSRDGKTLGGVVRSGPVASDFETAFSVGDSLIVVKDDKRISVQSISTGEEQMRAYGMYPASSAKSGLISVAEKDGNLSIYEYSTGMKRVDYAFPENIVYAHFSADGKRLLVLTEFQTIYVLDLGTVISTSK